MAAAAVAYRFAAKPAARVPEGSPVLLIGQGATPEVANDALTRCGVGWDPKEEDGRAATLTLAAIGDGELARIKSALDDLNARLDVRENPLVEDLEDGEPDEPLLRVLRSLAFRVTASAAITSHRWAAPERTIVVAAAERCETQEHVRCLPAWGDADDDLGRRARFFAWPITGAAVLVFADDAGARRARDAIRATSLEPKSKISLALLDEDLAGRAAATFEGIRAAARRAYERIPKDTKGPSIHVLEALARGSEGRVVRGVRLAPSELMVVPKLGSLADVSGFVAEVEASLPAGNAPSWKYRPKSLAH